MKAPFTLQMLIDAEACEPQVDLFRETFGNSVNVTVARAKKVAGLFDWGFAQRFLDGQGKADFDRTNDAAWADYERTRAAAWADLDRICDAARADFDRTNDAALADYNRARDAALDDYRRTSAAAWATAYIATCCRKGAVK
jgi:hypothetical protein